MSKHAFTIVVAVVIGLSLLLYLFMYQVRQNEVAVVLTFGNPSQESPEPGLHAQWPWPIQEVHRFDNRLHVYEGRFEETPTSAQYNIITSLSIGWQIGDVLRFNENFGRADDPIGLAWTNLEPIVRTHTLATLGQYGLHDLVSAKAEELKYDDIEAEILEAAQADARETYGIDVSLLRIKRLELPQSVTNQVYARMNSERNTEAQKIMKEGQQRAEVIKADAESKRKQILAIANAEAVRIRGQGDAEAAEYYKEFAKNPELAIYLRQLDALKKVTEKNTTIIVDATTPPFNLLVEEPPHLKNPAEITGSAKGPQETTPAE